MKTCKRCERSLPLVKFSNVNSRGRKYRRNICRACEGAALAKNAASESDRPRRFTRPLAGVKRFLITSAQNATPVDPKFFAALEVAAKHMRAELVVIPLRYKNPTSIWSKNDERDDWWAAEVVPYLHNTRKKLCDNLVLAADVKTQPTAVSPLSGFEALTGAESCIIGHPKMQFKAIAAPTSQFPKILSTTGSCTKRNYSDTKTGKLGAFHHYLGAVVVEVEGKHFHLRQVNADREDGSFIDLDRVYSARGVRPAPPPLAIIFGDIHARFIDKKVERATFGPGGICDVLKPRARVWHDVFDGYSVNHHHLGNPFIAAAKASAKLGNVEEEVKFTVEFIAERTPKGCDSVVVASNHDDFLSRWIVAADWKHSGSNAEFYLETALAMERSSRMTPMGAVYADPFAHWVEKLKGTAPIRCLDIDESFVVADIECGYHGHAGPNGTKATMKNMARIGAKVVDAHAHTPGIEEGHYKVGTSTPRRLEYSRRGPSSWLNTHCLIYSNGKRALITIVEDSWHVPPSKRTEKQS